MSGLRNSIAAAIETRIRNTLWVDPATNPGVVGQPFAATFCDLADDAVAVVAQWLRDEATVLALAADGALDHHRAHMYGDQARAVERLADSLTPTTGQETRT